MVDKMIEVDGFPVSPPTCFNDGPCWHDSWVTRSGVTYQRYCFAQRTCEAKPVECRKCKLLDELFQRTPLTNRDYWVMTELFVYLHDGKDYCRVKL